MREVSEKDKPNRKIDANHPTQVQMSAFRHSDESNVGLYVTSSESEPLSKKKNKIGLGRELTFQRSHRVQAFCALTVLLSLIATLYVYGQDVGEESYVKPMFVGIPVFVGIEIRW